jgi:glycosyltransferase involved in cell wall biosynthesis
LSHTALYASGQAGPPNAAAALDDEGVLYIVGGAPNRASHRSVHPGESASMAKLECALAEAEIKPAQDGMLLSVVIPSYNRVAELKLAVESLASQLTGGLESKVEIVISDNASGPETIALIRTLAQAFPAVSYLVHSRDEGGFFNLFAAPWRARGRYCWTFGSDDVLLDGGLETVVRILEVEAPSFLTLNKRAAKADLSGLLWERANAIPDRRFEVFADLFAAVGINQLAFISCQIEDTLRARTLDAEPYLRTDTRHPHVAAFLEKHHDRPCFYGSGNHVVHRLDNSQLAEYHAGNFFDYAAPLPSLIWDVMDKVGASKDLFERVTGQKRIQSYDPPTVTFIDTMFENMLRAARFSRFLAPSHKRTIEQILAHCRPDRQAQFDDIWAVTQQLAGLEHRSKALQNELDGLRETVMKASAMFTQPNVPG